MYNGIGLTTVRGSGTNGYVTRNMAHVSATRSAHIKNGSKDGGMRGFEAPPAPKRANNDILLHNHKRDIEVKCVNLQEKLEEQGVEADEADRRVAELRASLLAKLPAPGAQAAAGSSSGRSGETHADAASKDRETLALKDALGISSGYVGGSAFDRELQEREKQERAAKREAEEAERVELMAILEREQAREERQKEKEARRAEKEERRAEKKRQKKQGSKRPRSCSD
jgi:serine/arginine repetitive matrix protein 2